MQLKPLSLPVQGKPQPSFSSKKNSKTNFQKFSLLTIIMFLFIMLFINSKTHAQIISDAPPFVLTMDQLKSWTSSGPTADARNVSSVPLATRFTQTSTQLNPSLSNDMKVMFAPDGINGSGNYIDEQSQFNLYNFTNWSYIDKFIWFGGPVLIPSVPWTNTAHKNGVKMYGGVFFAPNVFGGNDATVSNFLEKDSNGKFIAAQKLRDISTFYKFDGWFINMETNTTSSNGQLMREFVEELKSILPENQQVIWYDAMLTNGQVWWQNELNSNNSTFLQDRDTRVSDAMFVNFFWRGSFRPNNSKNTAQSIGRSEFDVFTGVDVWPGRNQSPFESGGNRWMESLHDGNTPITSLGLFAANAVFLNGRYSNFRTVDNDVERDRFYNADKHFFGGLDLNPETIDETGFKGLSNWIPAASSITTLPFKTSFNIGHGRVFSENGAQTTRNWHDINKQDVLPTWQFAFKGTNDLKPSFDFTTAYNGGTSLKVEGSLKDTGNTNLKLYKTKLPIANDTKIDITYTLGKIGETYMSAIVAFTDDPTKLIPIPIGKSRSSGWNIKTVDLSAYAGRELALFGFQFSSDTNIEDYKINIGELKIFNGLAGELNPPIANFDADRTSLIIGESIKFSSTASTGASYRVWFFPGGSPRRSTEENPTVTYTKIGTYPVKLLVVSRNGFDIENKVDYIAVDNNPIANFTVNATEVQVGKPVDFINTSINDTSWLWSFPGGSPSSSTDENPSVIYNTVGAFDVTLTATNIDGSNTITKDRYISALDSTGIDHTDPVGTGIITEDSAFNANFDGKKAFDNLADPSNFTKWVALGIPSESAPSWVQIQFPEAKIVNTLTLVSPNDAADRDPEEFRLLGSNDGTNFTLLESWTGQFFTDPFVKKVYPFSNNDSYTYYRLEVTKNKDEVNLTQIAEIELIGPEQRLVINNLSLQQSELKIYPVPAKNTITLEGDFPKNSTMQIISMVDKRVLKSTPIISNKATIQLSGVSQGVYIVTINNNGSVLATRIISVK